MAITVNILYTGENGNAKAFAKEMQETGIVQKIREEQGNLRYEYYVPLEEENSVLLIDAWENQEAIDKHHDSEMMPEIARLREKYDLKMQVRRYLDDEAGPTEKDKQFIRS